MGIDLATARDASWSREKRVHAGRPMGLHTHHTVLISQCNHMAHLGQHLGNLAPLLEITARYAAPNPQSVVEGAFAITVVPEN